ncbi:unnamed protein product [Calicophoron daubneyi]|uniref:tRNA-intron lyase n=1 Tax=Calicophoron daubneyi TaxID=300641 RepID=A0AAV2SY54_CALDB
MTVDSEDLEWILGRPKPFADSGSEGCVAGLPFPIPLADDMPGLDDTAKSNVRRNFPTFRASLVDSGRAVITAADQIAILRNRGFYGYLPDEEQRLGTRFEATSLQSDTDSDDAEITKHDPADGYTPSQNKIRRTNIESDSAEKISVDYRELYLNDVEILFLFHALGCLEVILPPTHSSASHPLSSPHRLWYYLCTGRSSGPCLDPSTARTEEPDFVRSELSLLRRYAAYLYYRSRGWVVRPGLALGGVDYLLYAHGPIWRHAAFGVLVDRVSDAPDGPQLTCASVVAHMRVIHAVGKRLILCRVGLPPLNEYADCPWDAVRGATTLETLIDHWTPNNR